VIVSLTTDRLERVRAGNTLMTSRGPLTIESSARHQDRWRVRFVGVDDRNAADTLHGLLLYAEPIDDPDAYFVHELIGCRVIDLRVTDPDTPAGGAVVAVAEVDIGEVVSVEANLAHDLLVLDSGALIPLVFVTERQPGRLLVELPTGLLDL
jgi:16S rRNA processing protein RimM